MRKSLINGNYAYGYDFNLYSVEEALQMEENTTPARLNEAVNMKLTRPAVIMVTEEMARRTIL